MTFHYRMMWPALFLLVLAWGATPLMAQETGSDQIVLTVEGQDITESEVLQEIEALSRQIGPQLQNSEKPKEIILFPVAKSRLISAILLKNIAEEKEITVSEEEIDARMQQIQSQMPSEAQFEQALKQQGMTKADLRNQLEEQLLLSKVLEQEIDQPEEPSAEEVESFYNENKQQMVQPEMVHASHILIATSELSEPQKQEAKQELLALKEDIQEGEITFAEAAKEHSDCPSKARGGDLGSFPRGKMVPSFDEAAFNAEPGTITDIVETQFGYHIIKVQEHNQEGVMPLNDELKGRIRDQLSQTKDREAVKEYMLELQESADVQEKMTQAEWEEKYQGEEKKHQIKIDPNLLNQ